MHSLTLDIETRRLASEVGGWGPLIKGKGGASAIVIWSTEDKRPHLFDDESIEAAAANLESCDLLLSFNGVGFDIPVLESLLERHIVLQHHLDLLQLTWEALDNAPGMTRRSKGYSLNDQAHRCLGRTKSGSGLDAPKLSDEGRFGQLFEYCLDDVILTREMFQFVQDNGGVLDTNGDLLLLDLPDWFPEVSV